MPEICKVSKLTHIGVALALFFPNLQAEELNPYLLPVLPQDLPTYNPQPFDQPQEIQLFYAPSRSQGTGLLYQTQTGPFERTSKSLGNLGGRRLTTPTGEARVKLGVPLTRHDPEFAHLKAGPLFLKLDAMSARVAYTDFNSISIDPPSDDGWISILDLSGRAFLEITDDLNLTIGGTVYYLPLESEVGIDLFAASRSFGRLDWFGKAGSWDFHAFDEFRVYHRANDLLDPIEVDEIDTAGRYRFGRRDDQFRTDRFFNNRSLTYSNLLSAQASTLLSSHNRLSFTYQREDYWRSIDFQDHRERDRFEARLGNDGTLPFSPYISYLATTNDRWDTIQHRIWHGGHGRLTENLRTFARIGYHWNTGDDQRSRDRMLYEAGLIHDINQYTRHSLYGGHIFTENRFGDEGLYKYLRYTIAHQATNGIGLRGFASVYNRDEDSFDGDHTRWLLGASAHIPLGDKTHLRLLTRHEITDRPDDTDSNRWIHQATLRRRLSERLHADLRYRYEDYRRPDKNFDEHLISFGLHFTF